MDPVRPHSGVAAGPRRRRRTRPGALTNPCGGQELFAHTKRLQDTVRVSEPNMCKHTMADGSTAGDADWKGDVGEVPTRRH